MSVCLISLMLTWEKPPVEAQRLWEMGQEAMFDGQADKALQLYQQSLKADPTLARNHLSMAAAFLEKGQDAAAAPCMARYLLAQPEHYLIRSHYAELLMRLNRLEEARAQMERFASDIQKNEELARQHQVRAHTRLMEMAALQQDDYAEHLYRGMGLYFLARQRADLPEEESDLSIEGLLCKAAAELSTARSRAPEEARTWWYLALVWQQLGQDQPASRALRSAQSLAPGSSLTPIEQRDLNLAIRQWQAIHGQK